MAIINNGGIDLNPLKMNMQIPSGPGIKFKVDAAMLARLRHMDGLTPVVGQITALPVGTAGTQALRLFLGI